ncbi:MAG: SbcC/MukB-like Walker B domain-containing protein, partial [Lachnospiraceae bacterium]|nr:SbcC/MukB-like Walker B domain-containing protein [Lachnospiraceae bacterium]
MLYYQETIAVKEEIQNILFETEKKQQQRKTCELEQERLLQDLATAQKRLEIANQNDILVDMNRSIEGLRTQVRDLEYALTEHEKAIGKLKRIQDAFSGELRWLPCSMDNPERRMHILQHLGEYGDTPDQKTDAFLEIKKAAETIAEKLNTDKVHLQDHLKQLSDQIQEYRDRITELDANILQFPPAIQKAKKLIAMEFEKKGIQADVKTLAEYVESIKDEAWRGAIETFLGRKRYFLIVDGVYCKTAIRILKEKGIHDATVVMTDKLAHHEVKKGSAAEQLQIHNIYARQYANYLLNGIHLCADLDELHEYPKGGLTREGMLAKGYAVSYMNIKKTEMCLGQNAILLQKKAAQEKLDACCSEKQRVKQELEVLNSRRDSLSLVNWNDTDLVFSAPDSYRADSEKNASLKADIQKYTNNPAFQAVLAEQQKAEKLYKEAFTAQSQNSGRIEVLKKDISYLENQLIHLRRELQEKEKEYNEQKLLRLELNRPMKEEYEKLRTKSSSARAITPKYVAELKGTVNAAEKKLEDAQLEYCRLAETDITRRGAAFIPFYREQYHNIATVRIEEARNQMEEKGKELESAFMRDFIGEISEAIRTAEDEIALINAELKQLPFGLDTYRFVMTPRSDRLMFFKIRDRLMDYANSADFYLSTNREDEEMEHSIQEFMDRILTEEDESEYTDYRKYFTYDMKIIRKNGDTTIESDLSKKQGSASNGEKQTPYFIILAASLMQCYPKNNCCMRLAFIDEAFSALSRERIEQMVRYFEENHFQVIYAAPPEKISSIGQYITSTVSLFTSGNYTYAVEGQEKMHAY